MLAHKNLTSTEVALKYGKDVMGNAKVPLEKDLHPLVHKYTALPLGTYLSEVREELLIEANKGLIPNNTLSKVEKWSRDGEHIYLYRGQRIGCDVNRCVSWTLTPSLALHFATHPTVVYDGYDREVVVMKVPLSVIEDITVGSVDFGHEVICNTRSELFHKMFAEVETLTPTEARERKYHYVDTRYEYETGVHPFLREQNEFPFNLIYPPYPSDLPNDGKMRKWCMDTLQYKESL